LKPGRKLSLTADFFPHFSKHNSAVRIINQKFGNDGYSTYYKLKELLGQTPGHCIDLRERINYEDALSYFQLEDKRFREIMRILVISGEVDEKLWSENVIWSETFIYDLRFLYIKRDTTIEGKPTIEFGKMQLPIFTKQDERVKIENGKIETENLLKKYKIKRKEFKDMAKGEMSDYFKKVDAIFREKYQKNKGIPYTGSKIDARHYGIIQGKLVKVEPTKSFNTEQMLNYYDNFFDAVTKISEKESKFLSTITIPFLDSQLDSFMQHINKKTRSGQSEEKYSEGITV
jgi:hypothetical protein